MKLFVLAIVFLFTNLSVSGASLKDHETWMGIYFQDKKLGFSYVRLKIEGIEIVVNTKVYFRMMSEGGARSTNFTQETRLAPDLKLKKFILVQELMGHLQKIKAEVDNSTLKFYITSSDFKQNGSISLPPVLSTSATYLLNIVNSGLFTGKKGKAPVLVESLQVIKELTYEVLRKEKTELEGKEIEAYVLKQNMGGIASTLWITESGMILREESQQGFRSVREPESVATDLGEDIFPMSRFIALSLIRPGHEIYKPRYLKKIKLVLSGMSSSDLIPSDHRQKVLITKKLSNGSYSSTIMIDSEALSFEESDRPPISIKDSEYPLFLGASPEIQVNHPDIVALSKLLTQKETDAWLLAKIINKWVYENMEKTSWDAVTALDALRERRGECQSHTYLFAALARATGIPTKIVNGLVYSEDYGGFLFHAWPEVFVGEWRALDPTLGQDRLDATHIKLTENERDYPFKMMAFVGRIAIEIVE